MQNKQTNQKTKKQKKPLGLPYFHWQLLKAYIVAIPDLLIMNMKPRLG